MDFEIDVAPRPEVTKKLVVNCAPISAPRGGVRGCVATFDDLTALHFANERLSDALGELRASRDEIAQKNVELEHMATHDVLTGCLSRGAFFQRMAQAWEDARRTGRPLSCLALDIDKFKSVNDGFGHAAGDRVIQHVGGALVGSLRAADVVGRYGGDEFLVGMPGCDLEQALAVADKLRRAVEERCQASLEDLRGLHVTVSIGVAAFNDGWPRSPTSSSWPTRRYTRRSRTVAIRWPPTGRSVPGPQRRGGGQSPAPRRCRRLSGRSRSARCGFSASSK